MKKLLGKASPLSWGLEVGQMRKVSACYGTPLESPDQFAPPCFEQLFKTNAHSSPIVGLSPVFDKIKGRGELVWINLNNLS